MSFHNFELLRNSGYLDKCLQFGILDTKLVLAFYDDDLSGNTTLNIQYWYHIAYVYDRSISKQIVYLNGDLDGQRTPIGSFKGNASQMVLGSILPQNWPS